MLLTPDSEVADVIVSACLLAASLLLGFRRNEHNRDVSKTSFAEYSQRLACTAGGIGDYRVNLINH